MKLFFRGLLTFYLVVFTISIFKELNYPINKEYNDFNSFKKELRKIENDSTFVNLASEEIGNLFKYDYRPYFFWENPILSAVNFFHPGIAQVIDPEFLFKHSDRAFCGQMCKILTVLFEDRKLNYRYVSFSNHLCIEVEVSGKWFFLDPTKVISWENSYRSSLNSGYNNQEIRIMEGKRIDLHCVNYLKTNYDIFWKLSVFEKGSFFLWYSSFVCILAIQVKGSIKKLRKKINDGIIFNYLLNITIFKLF